MELSFLEDEKFDFDVPLSPEDEINEEEEDDEIFFGPVGHTERCIATNASSQATKLIDEMDAMKTLSPLNAEQVVEIFKEATSLAVMLKSCSSDAPESDSEEQNRNNFPELITDINKSTKTCENQDVEKVSEIGTTKKKDDGCEDCGGFIVRRRALRERNPVNVKCDVNSPKSQQQTPIRSANKKSMTRPTKSALTTPRRTSVSSSRDERKSSNANNTSFSEDKSVKIPVPSNSGLKAPGFSCRRRTSSNSSTSSTSSIPGSNLNETFTIKSNEPSKTSNLKQPGIKPKLSTKAALTKPVTSKPVFAKPSDIPKTSKLQPMKAVQARSLSTTVQRSPVRLRSKSRPVSSGSTPLKVHLPMTDDTSNSGTTPIRRRGSNTSSCSNNIASRSMLDTTTNPYKGATPQNKKKATGIPGIAGQSKGSAPVARLPGSAMKSTIKNRSGNNNTTTKSTTPEYDKIVKKTSGGTLTPDQKPKASKNVNKRRSLLPTPNAMKTERKSPKDVRPLALRYSPDVPKTIERAKDFLKKLDRQSDPIVTDMSHTCKQEATGENVLDTNPILKENLANETSDDVKAIEVKEDSSQVQSQEPIKNLSRDNSNLHTSTVEPDLISSETTAVIDEPDLMIQDSPETVETPPVDVLADPFSPGIDTPTLTPDDVLTPIVVTHNSKDLIDLSYQSPKPEVDLIDLDAKSPLIEAKLVDI